MFRTTNFSHELKAMLFSLQPPNTNNCPLNDSTVGSLLATCIHGISFHVSVSTSNASVVLSDVSPSWPPTTYTLKNSNHSLFLYYFSSFFLNFLGIVFSDEGHESFILQPWWNYGIFFLSLLHAKQSAKNCKYSEMYTLITCVHVKFSQ